MDTFFSKGNTAMSAILLLIGILSSTGVEFTGAQSVGVCYGGSGNNLPTKEAVVDLYKSNGIGRMRIYDPDEGALQALRGSNIEVILGVSDNNKLQDLTNAGAATDWVNKYVKAYSPDVKIKYIAIGNEVHPGDAAAGSVLPVLQNIQNAVSSANLQGQIKVSTAIDTTLITNSYPPKDGVFTDSASQYIKPIISFLVSNGAPLLANVYPYFSYVNNQQSIGLDYALFTKQGANEVGYQNLFDALLDSVYAALEKVGAPNVKVVVSESGWPSEGGTGATVDNAATYYKNLINHAKGGTPMRPNGPIETYLFAMFDENQKQGPEIEKHFGLFRPDKSPKYQLSFN
ncbi:glucan endo-1,3-beta-glucosidase-like [Gastrolobium bilobum]|uniref:glucan endo-1,3-beta-glucosidase-like n=1 Tax=Gastrolobium bilobum TaxID=150636 RepID=UPI002AB18043|nr:glucan endo-1,3-beta-glucosidase-like [Gastrolobium bilobum]XP_061369842.1 glucan endo-1,3-beta-glucosidase-like [Gastrolobium bilobum]